jgi:exopolyphosphatase/guanosine-5'-triphosphate,3'-diphosphate pyrophosphatase
MATVGAAVDVGSNSIHLLVALVTEERDGVHGLSALDDRSELLGLGDIVDLQHEIPADVRHDVVDTLVAYLSVAQAAGAGTFIMVGTEPLRRAANIAALQEELRGATGRALHVLTERQEAQLTFVGVTAGRRPEAPLLVVDIGGGSTELALFRPGGGFSVLALPLGSARLTNAIIEHDPPTDEELDRLHAAAAAVRRMLPVAEDTSGMGRLRVVFVGGTATNVARLGHLDRGTLARHRQLLHSLTAAEICERFTVRPRRARQLAAGAAIVDVLLEHFGLAEADASEASLRDGAILASLRFGEAWPEHVGEMIGW